MSRPSEPPRDFPPRKSALLPHECPACGHVAAARKLLIPQPYPEADIPAWACARCGALRLASPT